MNQSERSVATRVASGASDPRSLLGTNPTWPPQPVTRAHCSNRKTTQFFFLLPFIFYPSFYLVLAMTMTLTGGVVSTDSGILVTLTTLCDLIDLFILFTLSVYYIRCNLFYNDSKRMYINVFCYSEVK